jgi:S-DNA-T family DNA segregation ATPase FtsK/SpoIIIE
VLRVGRGPHGGDETALRARLHLAVVAGPDCGALAALDGDLVMGRRTGPDGPEGPTGPGVGLAIDDPAVSRQHVLVHPGPRGARARDLGTLNGTVLVRRGRDGAPGDRPRTAPPLSRWLPGRAGSGRHLGPRGARLRPGDRLVLGASVVELRGPEGRGRQRTQPPAPTGAGPGAWVWFGPAIGSAALAATTGNPVLLVCALLGPGVAAGQLVVARARSRRGRAASRRPGGGAPGDPAGRPGPGRHHRAGPGEGTGTGPPVEDDAQDSSARALLAPADLCTATLDALSGATRRRPHGPASEALVHAAAPRVAGGSAAIAVVGPRPAALAVARALALSLVGPHGARPLDVVCDTALAPDWRWARWLTSAPASPGATSRTGGVVVLDGAAAVARARTVPSVPDGPTTTTVLLPRTEGGVPAWCRTVLEVDRAGAVLRTASTRGAVTLHGVDDAWAERQARRVAAARTLPTRGRSAGPGLAHGGAGHPGDDLPAHAVLGDLADVPADAAGVAERWLRARPGALTATLGVGRAGPLTIDLVRDGPHALVAGTTGAGKSGLLQTLVLAAALAHPPEHLAVALVDYKGGASFGPVADLPHVVGQVTDLDGTLAARALTGLRAELHRREQLLADAGASDLPALWAAHHDGRVAAAPPPRLLVVVDEFRALADEVPDFVPGLLRLAAQGRSLGMHLVLATQRPAGAVGPDLRANIALRIALRVADPGESIDVLDAPDAAAISPRTPGRAVLRRGSSAPEGLQVALPHGPEGGPRATPAPAWLTAGATWVPSTARPGPPDEALRRYVDVVRAAAHGHPAPASPWLPELPLRLGPGEVTAVAAHGAAARGGHPVARTSDPRPAVRLGVGDLPAEQRRSVVTWQPADGHLLVVGGPGSGRTTTLRTVGAGAVALGWDVHAVGFGSEPPAAPDHLGTVVDPQDPRRLARLVQLLAARAPVAASRTATSGSTPDMVPQLLIVDGFEGALAALERFGRGSAADLLLDLVRDGRARGVAVAASVAPTGPGAALAPRFGDRLVLSTGDALTDTLAGVPADLTSGRRPPGRAVHLGAHGAVLCQVTLTTAADPDGSRGLDGHRADARRRRTPALRLEPLPEHVAAPATFASTVATAAPTAPERPCGLDAETPDASAVLVGRGGDAAAAVRLRIGSGALVVGPPGSGRTHTLTLIAAELVRAGRDVAVVGRDAPLTGLAGTRWSVPPEGLDGLLADLDSCTTPVDVVVDDVDTLDDVATAAVGRLLLVLTRPDRQQHGEPPPAGPRGRLVVGATTARAATAYREPLATLRGLRTGIVLSPAEPGSGDVLGTTLEWTVDPSRPHAPGRGALVHGRTAVPIQVALLAQGARTTPVPGRPR